MRLLHCIHRPLLSRAAILGPFSPPPPPVLPVSAHGRHHVRVVRVPKGRVYGGGRGEHVSGVAEGRQVAHGHVSGHAEGGALLVQALGELLVGVAAPLVLLGLVGHFSVPRLDPLLLHGQRPVHLRKGERGVQHSGGQRSPGHVSKCRASPTPLLF